MPTAPSNSTVQQIAESALGAPLTVARVADGVSTYVYRIQRGDRIHYLRILPEEATFAVEVRVHQLLNSLGVRVPPVLYFEEHNPVVAKSIMIVDEIPGVSLKQMVAQDGIPASLAMILHEAGTEIAHLNTLPVDGYGWIDRQSPHTLRGENSAFRAFYQADLNRGLAAFPYLGFAPNESSRIAALLAETVAAVAQTPARLVHGDFDSTHIFCSQGNYSGLIDLGEIMGNHPLYDLALFRFYDDLPAECGAFAALCRGYSERTPLTADDLRTIDRLALLFGIWKVGKEMGKPRRNVEFLTLLAAKVRVQVERNS